MVDQRFRSFGVEVRAHHVGAMQCGLHTLVDGIKLAPERNVGTLFAETHRLWDLSRTITPPLLENTERTVHSIVLASRDIRMGTCNIHSGLRNQIGTAR